MFGFLKRKSGPSGFSSSSTAEDATAGIDGSGLVAIVTGGSGGIGAETCRVLALRGVHVVMGVRNTSAGELVKEEIVKKVPPARIEVLELDVSSMSSVRRFVDSFSALNLPLNILINNAGIAFAPFTLSEDGIELQFATNYLGHFLLTDLLLEKIKGTAKESGIEGRVVIVASDSYKHTYREGIRFDKINDESRYKSIPAYGQSKLANIFHANELSSRLKEEGAKVLVNSLHPGAVATNITRHLGFIKDILSPLAKLVLRSVEQRGPRILQRDPCEDLGARNQVPGGRPAAGSFDSGEGRPDLAGVHPQSVILHCILRLLESLANSLWTSMLLN